MFSNDSEIEQEIQNRKITRKSPDYLEFKEHTFLNNLLVKVLKNYLKISSF